MSIIPFTNTAGDGQVPGVNPDATTDYFLVSDYNNDKNYWHAKVCEAIKYLSGDQTETFQILYGGVVSDAGSSKINISEGAAIGKDESGNYRIISIPALTNVSLPSGWINGRQIWVIGKYNTKLGSAERQHFNGTTYHYQVIDSYLGEEDTNDLFVDSNPYNTVIKWGSFEMNGTTFINRNDRSAEWTSPLKAKIVNDILQPGDMILATNGTRPGCLPCDGAAVSRTTYASLLAAMPKTTGTVVGISIGSSATLTLGPTSANILRTGMSIQFTTTGTFPTGLSAGTIYYLRFVGSGGSGNWNYNLYDTLAHSMDTNSTTGIINTSVSQSGIHSYETYFYGNGDGADTFNVPDLRGVVPRGTGTSAGYIYNVNITAGERSDDQFQGHRMGPLSYSGILVTDTMQTAIDVVPSGSYVGANYGTTGDPVTDGTHGAPRTGYETRGKSLGVYYVIKY
ncbi:hypothetical protein [Leptospira sp. 'Mane']|uniref:hypothetical protein n=1 Tax=Leptospira sp. 'Mane' TaxID=3387407 RepID=UPI00398BA753